MSTAKTVYNKQNRKVGNCFEDVGYNVATFCHIIYHNYLTVSEKMSFSDGTQTIMTANALVTIALSMKRPCAVN